MAGFEDRVVLDLAGNNVLAFAGLGRGYSEDRPVIRFASPAGEVNLLRP